jgi:hypothetical protein
MTELNYKELHILAVAHATYDAGTMFRKYRDKGLYQAKVAELTKRYFLEYVRP